VRAWGKRVPAWRPRRSARTLSSMTASLVSRPEVGPFGELALPLVTIAAVLVALFTARRLFERHERSVAGHRFRDQSWMVALTLLGALVVILELPIQEETRTDLLRVVGLLLSASIALASTTPLGNVLAGLMLRSGHSFRSGDFLRVEGHFGRVTERGLFFVEIQTEDRDLTTLPNLYLATHPMTVVRAPGTIVSALVDIGYDVSHARVRPMLEEAARRAGLEEAFVRVAELGDFTVQYRVGGLLVEVEELLTRRSSLHEEILDALHAAGVEIAATSVAGLREELGALTSERADLERRRKEQVDERVRQALADELERLSLREQRLRAALRGRELEGC